MNRGNASKWRDFKISAIKIQNFKGIESLELEIGKRFNVIVGENGSGKSTIIKAFLHLMSCLTRRISLPEMQFYQMNKICSLEVHFGDGLSWKISTDSDNDETSDLGSIRKEITHNNGKNSLPVVAYYGASRFVSKHTSKVGKGKDSYSPRKMYSLSKSIFEGFKPLFAWISDCYEEPSKRGQLEFVKEVGKSVLSKYDSISNRISFLRKGYTFEFDELSEGEKCLFALVADIARQLIIANNGDENPLEGDGIIFIDEIDLHLHPNMQIDMVEKLERLFPNCQFIVTSNSPFVVSNLQTYKGDKLIHIEGSSIYSVPDNVYGEKVDNMLIEFFNAKTLRNNEMQKHIDKVWSALADGDYKLEHAENDMNWLNENLSSDDIEFVKIKFEQLKQKKDYEKNK